MKVRSEREVLEDLFIRIVSDMTQVPLVKVRRRIEEICAEAQERIIRDCEQNDEVPAEVPAEEPALRAERDALKDGAPSMDEACPHPARSGRHEEYVGKDRRHCRACGAVADLRKPLPKGRR